MTDQTISRTFLLERFWPGVTRALAEEATVRLRVAAARCRGEGLPIRHLESSLIPHDEVVVTFVEAPSVTAVREFSAMAAYATDRISESIPVGRQGGKQRR
jgi:hypothetical protein